MSDVLEAPRGATTGIPKVVVGQKVWYMADTDAHGLDTDHRGELLSAFEHTRNFGSPKLSYKDGERVTNFGLLGRGKWKRVGDGEYQTPGGHTIRVTGPGEPWPAIVRAVFADGSVALDIAHPLGGALEDGHKAFEQGTFITLHYPSAAAIAAGLTSGVRYSNAYESHTWHLFEEKKAV